jgi:hypothetical protein
MRDSRAIRPVRAGRVQATKEHNDAVQDQIDHRRGDGPNDDEGGNEDEGENDDD